MEAVKNQLKAFEKTYQGEDKAKGIIEEIKEVLSSIQEWQGKLIQRDQKTYQDVINYTNRLNAEITNLMGVMSSADPILTAGMIQRKKDLLSEWSTIKTEQMKITDVIDRINTAYRDSGLPLIKY